MLSYKDVKDTAIDDITKKCKVHTTFVAIIYKGKEIDRNDTSFDVIIHIGKRCPQ